MLSTFKGIRDYIIRSDGRQERECGFFTLFDMCIENQRTDQWIYGLVNQENPCVELHVRNMGNMGAIWE